jgi:major membrane immunogen (membrane-anchored lipoprotein)
MKKIIVVVALLILVACNSNDDNNNETHPNANIVTDLPQGLWKITYSFDNNTDQTSTYSGINFNFDASGWVTAGNDILSETGSWTYEDASNDSSDDDGIENDEELILVFSDTGFFGELSDNWHITSASATKVELFDERNGSMQFLTFSKQ